MQFDNIRVSRKLWGAFLGLMIAMLLLSAFAQNRGNSSMSAAMDAVVEIEARISAAVRWRGATETAVTMVMGGAVTGRGNIERVPTEFNIGFDPEAAWVVFEAFAAAGKIVEVADWEAVIAKFRETYTNVEVNLQIEGWDDFSSKVKRRFPGK